MFVIPPLFPGNGCVWAHVLFFLWYFLFFCFVFGGGVGRLVTWRPPMVKFGSVYPRLFPSLFVVLNSFGLDKHQFWNGSFTLLLSCCWMEIGKFEAVLSFTPISYASFTFSFVPFLWLCRAGIQPFWLELTKEYSISASPMFKSSYLEYVLKFKYINCWSWVDHQGISMASLSASVSLSSLLFAFSLSPTFLSFTLSSVVNHSACIIDCHKRKG